MKKINLILAIIIGFGMILLVSHLIYAQQQGGGQPPQNPQQRPQFDPQQMMERRMQQIMERLKLSDEESAIIKPKIESLTRMRMEQGQELRPLMEALQKALDSKDTKQITSALKAVKDKRAEQKQAYEKAEQELLELLTVEQEANLTVMGVVNSDGIGMMFGGFRPGGPEQGREQRQRQGNQQRQGN